MQAVATVAAHRAIQFPGLFALSSTGTRPIQRNVQRTYANQVRDSILRCTRQPSGIQADQLRKNFLRGVEVQEISMEDWLKANEAYQPVWFV